MTTLKNPIITARESHQLTQQQLSQHLGVSQQFVQRVESGAAPVLPLSFADYYGFTLTLREKRDIYADLLIDTPVGLEPPPYVYTPSISQTYRQWVRITRGMLPSLKGDYKTRGGLLSFLLSELGVLTPLAVSQLLHVRPITLDRYFRDLKLSVDPIPETLREAIAESGVLTSKGWDRAEDKAEKTEVGFND